ncbi:hypothetical protein JJV70_06800 [Streptomyces sp. JJ66]|uniref:hypothetical protein n=1 Tax=Streptomyces sp. JJ66 TaxID=2803843 RepID=UPI001C58B2B5|nr:hypothetical protein [Streptomyces sp. JJ66]MBW1601821.1 hypothetical protein [Streptomyces sp. JJ66]
MMHPAHRGTAVRGVRRTLLIVLLSHDSRTILLEHRRDEPAWRPLCVDVPSHRSYARAAHQWQRRWGSCSGMRRGSVTGRLTVGAASGRHDYHLVILKLSREEDPRLFSCYGRWWPVVDVDSAVVFPRELGVLMTGYVGGWIPDGPIALDA